ncbi:MAG: pilus assembly protein PilP, partial [Nevskia sp.]|nr:pilus assembly protein PilP [Nevskia sp.]
MIKAPDGVIHRVSVGNYMGQNFGKITKISESEVDLDEIVPDGFGGFKEQPASLAAEQK